MVTLQGRTVLGSFGLALAICSLSSIDQGRDVRSGNPPSPAGRLDVLGALQPCAPSLVPHRVSIVGQSAPEGELFARIVGGLLLPEGNFVVADAGSLTLRFYDTRGSLRKVVGRRGSGPGEFRRLSGVWHLSDSLLATYDSGLMRVSIFRHDGSLARDFRILLAEGVRWPAVIGTIGNRIVAINGQSFEAGQFGTGVVRPPFVFLRFGPDGRVQDTVFSAPGTEYFVHSPQTPLATRILPFGASLEYALGHDQLFVGDNAHGVISSIRPRSEPKVLLRINAPRAAITRDHIQRYKSEASQRATTAVEVAMARDLDRIPFPKVFPVFDKLIADDSRRLWVRLHAYPDTAARVWLVLPNGSSTPCRVTLPARTTPLEIRGDIMLAVSRSLDDEEHVHLFRFPQ